MLSKTAHDTPLSHKVSFRHPLGTTVWPFLWRVPQHKNAAHTQTVWRRQPMWPGDTPPRPPPIANVAGFTGGLTSQRGLTPRRKTTPRCRG